jgi:UDP-N-acetylmuramoylalanine--D-glutamate ligase
MNDFPTPQLPEDEAPMPGSVQEPVREPVLEPVSEQEAQVMANDLAAELSVELGGDALDDAATVPLMPEASVEADPVPQGPILENQSVLVLGLGASGLAMVRCCAHEGAQVTVADTRAAPPQLATLQAELPQVRFVSGEFSPALLEPGIQAVFVSPGLAPAQTDALLQAARAQGLRVGGELALFAEGLARLRASEGYRPAVLAITGTNGKTTVTSLTGQLVERAGRTVAVAGNIGPTLLDTLAARRGNQSLPQVWVLELSSFQLDASGGADDFEPTAATVLNLSQDHLDWHGSMDAYAAAKARIFGKTGVMVLSRDDARVLAMLPAPVRLKGGKIDERAHMTFGAGMPTRPGDYGIEVVAGMAWLVRALEADETYKRRKDEEEELHFQRLMPADALRIRGRHNATNALAALALATAAGCPLGPMLYGLREYRGEPHRVEPVAIVHDIEYFDDSKGTNVGATEAALTGLGAERKLVVILGGEGKGQDFSPLAGPVARHCRAAVLIGRDAPLIREALAATLQASGVPLLDAGSMEDAVRLATERAHAGDAVLMSPACASFDMFRDYGHRAEVFRAAVAQLAEDAGQTMEGGL